jgi:hypothetical protein
MRTQLLRGLGRIGAVGAVACFLGAPAMLAGCDDTSTSKRTTKTTTETPTQKTTEEHTDKVKTTDKDR